MTKHLLLTFVLGISLLAARASAEGPGSRHVLLITIDGFPAYLLDDPKAPIPTLRALAKRGATAEGMRTVNPSVTWPNHTTLVTGVKPRRHSVIFNGILVRGESGQAVRVDPAHDQAELVAAPTIFDLLHKAGFTTAAIDWPCTRNSKTLDVNFPDVPGQVQYMSKPLRDELLASGALKDETDKSFMAMSGPGRDQVWTEAACRVIRENKPDFMLLHLLNGDAVHHTYGPQTMAGYTANALCDAQVRDVLAAIDQAGLTGSTTVIVTADHGFAVASKLMLPNVLFRQAGLLTPRPGGGYAHVRAQAISEGGSALIYLTDPATANEDRQKVRELLAGKEGIAAVIEPKDFDKIGIADPRLNPQAPDFVVMAKNSYAFDASSVGEDFIIPAVLGRHMVGNHGYDSDNAKMNAVFIAAGAGIVPHAHIGVFDNVDVAPTIARLFGIQMPNVDGKPLDDILAK